MVEHLTVNQRATGSSPVTPANHISKLKDNPIMKAIIENVGNIERLEIDITDLMVFVGPDGALNVKICDGIRNALHRESPKYRFVVIVAKNPEAGLFPTAQNGLVAHYASIINSGPNNRLLITTHSPYILTALNNYLYAYQVGQKYPDAVSALIPKHLWIDPRRVSAYFVENGVATSIMDGELQQIDADKIDEASTLSNALYDKLFDIKIDGEMDEEMRGIRVAEIDSASDLTNALHLNLLDIELTDGAAF